MDDNVHDKGNHPCRWITYLKNGRLTTVYYPKTDEEWSAAKQEIDALPEHSRRIEKRVLMQPSNEAGQRRPRSRPINYGRSWE